MKHFTTRLINQLRCLGSYALSIAGVHCVRHLPTFVSIEPANFCQLACPECPVGMRRANPSRTTSEVEPIQGLVSHKQGLLALDNYRRIIAQIAPYAHTVQLFWQGEPLLNDALPEMVKIAREAGLYTIVSTNAQRLDQPMAEALVQAGLNRIIVSMDGWTQQTYEQYRQGGDVEKVKQAVRYLRQARDLSPFTFHLSPFTFHRSPLIELQCLYLRTNEAEWSILRQEYRRLGADRLTMKTAQLYNYEQGSPLMPMDARYARYKWNGKLQRYELKRKMRKRCLRLWSGCVIDVQGDVLPCCYDKDKHFVLGNIYRQDLRDIWSGDKAAAFRRQLLSARERVPMCCNCDE